MDGVGSWRSVLLSTLQASGRRTVRYGNTHGFWPRLCFMSELSSQLVDRAQRPGLDPVLLPGRKEQWDALVLQQSTTRIAWPDAP